MLPHYRLSPPTLAGIDQFEDAKSWRRARRDVRTHDVTVGYPWLFKVKRTASPSILE
jgi:hypothetical protein